MTHVPSADGRLRITHLAFEDHLRPGSGGGGVRTHEINARLARRHDVTAVVARYPGVRSRVEDGVHYRPLGLRLGPRTSMISYHLALPWFLLRHRADVVVEDFSAPHSSDLVPLFTRCATVAVVQWLFAGQKSKQYSFPFWAFEATGIRVHRHFIAVSQYIADRIHELDAGAAVDVVYAGVAPPPCPCPPPARRHLLFLGRLEFHMKGLDLLVDAFEAVRRDWPEVRLQVAGDGPGDADLRARLAERGLLDEVDFLGRLDGTEKWDALRRAAIVLMPSRFETFGFVTLEAMAVGTPVVAFDIPSLREIAAGAGSPMLVEPGDGAGLGRIASELLGDRLGWQRVSEAGLGRARMFDWDRAALGHERVYRAAVAARRRRSHLRLLLRALRNLRPPRPSRSRAVVARPARRRQPEQTSAR